MAEQTRNPTSDEAVSGTWTGTAGSRYQNVDDYPDTGGTDFLAGGTATSVITFGFSVFTVPSGSTGISVDVDYHDGEASNGANNCGGRLKVGDNYYNAATHNPSGSGWTARTDNWATNPKTTTAWTVDDVNGVGANALQAFGINSTDSNPAFRFSGIRLRVTYTAPIDITPNNGAHAHTATSPTVGDSTVTINPNNGAHAHSATSPAVRKNWYASPSGSGSGDGSIGNPWDILTAINNSNSGGHAIQSGDLLYLRGGNYDISTPFTLDVWLPAGDANSHTRIFAYPGEKPVIRFATGSTHVERHIKVNNHYTWISHIELLNTSTDRSFNSPDGGIREPWRGMGIYLDSRNNCKVTYCYFNNIGIGVHIASAGAGNEFYGNIAYACGNNTEEHGAYHHGSTASNKIEKCISLWCAGRGIQLFTSLSTGLRYWDVEDNIVAMNGQSSQEKSNQIRASVSGSGIIQDIAFRRNQVYLPRSYASGTNSMALRVGDSAQDNGHTNITVTDNVLCGEHAIYLYEVRVATGSGNKMYATRDLSAFYVSTGFPTSGWSWDNNIHTTLKLASGAQWRHDGTLITSFNTWKSTSGIDTNTTFVDPPIDGGVRNVDGTIIFVAAANKYEYGRAHVAIFNWDQASSVNVDLSSVLQSGDKYEILSAFNFNGAAIATGTYSGGNVSFPMNDTGMGTVYGTLSGDAPFHPGLEFGAFVVRITEGENKVGSDSIVFTESALLEISITGVDAFTLSEQKSLEAVFSGTDNITLTESAEKSQAQEGVDNYSLSELSALVTDLIGNDAFSLGESASLDSANSFSGNDNLTVSEAALLENIFNGEDSVSLSESSQLSSGGNLFGTDNFLLSESGNLAVALAGSDAMVFSELAQLANQFSSGDNIVLSESTILVINLTGQESISLSEIASLSNELSGLDVFSLSEIAVKTEAGVFVYIGAYGQPVAAIIYTPKPIEYSYQEE